ncbi:hypothetical protein MIND_01310000 [Mycena indigotica]|uniref:HD domain-containing protein n=1 Tax=Mycena indigotica TaxID=2126181 RepID=A0A8H6S2K8_9AGAR|nr:uncharacterized protein MIND_01310000 [Mycena indigotica]KAF7290697.1 hypothetical protein MIND_01310000 [Mycena indigotica]
MGFPPTFDAYVPSSLENLLSSGKITPGYVSFDTLRQVPLDLEHTASMQYSQKITPPAGFDHCVRVYYFSLAILANGFPSQSMIVEQIPFADLAKRLYHACILHDLGWSSVSEGREHPAHAMSFEIHGGIMAYEHLLREAPTLNANQLGDIVQSIMLHTSQWPSGSSSTLKTLLSLAALFDIGGYDALGPGAFDFLINRQTVKEIEAAFPRGNLYAEGGESLKREFSTKPDCLLLHFPGGAESFIGVIRKESIVSEADI